MINPVLKDITIEITNQCQLRCQACGIWEEKLQYEISASRFIRMGESLLERYRIGFISITGGEPFLHPGIGGILHFLALLKHRGRITGFGVYTNGASPLLVKRVFKAEGLTLKGIDIGVSVDGDKPTHDKLRGKGAYSRTLKTLEFLAGECRDIAGLELKFTINAVNYQKLGEVYRFSRALNARFSPKITEDGVSAYYHRNGASKAAALAVLTPVMRLSVRRQIEEILADGGLGVDKGMILMLLRLLDGGRDAIKACSTPEHGLFITSRNEIYACLYMPPVGCVGADGLISEDLDLKRKELMHLAGTGGCPRCLAYHGFLKSYNLRHLA